MWEAGCAGREKNDIAHDNALCPSCAPPILTGSAQREGRGVKGAELTLTQPLS